MTGDNGGIWRDGDGGGRDGWFGGGGEPRGVGKGRRSDEVEAGAKRLLLRDVRERLDERAGRCKMRRHDQREAGRDEGEADVVHYYGGEGRAEHDVGGERRQALSKTRRPRLY